MGACASVEDRAEQERSEAIDKMIEEDSKKFRKECKILLLGSGESGKSTIVKQMKIIHQNGYTQDELLSFRGTVYKNLLESAQAIVLAMKKIGVDPVLSANRVNAERVLDYKIFGMEDVVGGGGYASANANANANGGMGMGVGAGLGAGAYASSAGIFLSTALGSSTLGADDSLEGTGGAVIPSTSASASASASGSGYGSNPVGGAGRAGSGKDVVFSEEIALAIHQLWQDPIIPKIMDHSSEFYLMDSASYFFTEVLRIGKQDYIPSVTDVLRARQKSTGIVETRFNMGQLSIHMFDVGGQRSERKKWIHCFESVTSIIFCTALSEYDQVLLEQSGQNRMIESLVLFESVINSRWFLRTSIILFLNKIDVFKSKLPKVPLEKYFPEYTGGPDINKAAKYILWRFMQANRARLSVYPHLTQATDTGNIRLVFAAVKETILQNALKDSGIL